jgi:hypothetical protein
MYYNISKLISADLTECVNSPTEIISTPVEATFLTFFKLIPPDASNLGDGW